jgi:hypothetical protein
MALGLVVASGCSNGSGAMNGSAPGDGGGTAHTPDDTGGGSSSDPDGGSLLGVVCNDPSLQCGAVLPNSAHWNACGVCTYNTLAAYCASVSDAAISPLTGTGATGACFLSNLLTFEAEFPDLCGQSFSKAVYEADNACAPGTGGGSEGDAGSSRSDAGPDAPSANVSDSSVPDAGDGGACSDLANTAPKITMTTIDGTDSAPTPMGGEIATGTYYLTSITNYETGSPSGPNVFAPGNFQQDTAVIEATSGTTGTYQVAVTSNFSQDGGPDMVEHNCGTYDVSRAGSSFLDQPYTSTPTGFILFDAGANLFYYMKQ